MGVVLDDVLMALVLGVGLGVLPFHLWLGWLVFNLTPVEIILTYCLKGGFKSSCFYF